MASRVAALLLLGVICIGFAAGEAVVDCCLRITDKPLPLHVIKSYTIQEAGQGCEKSATAFLTHAGRILCFYHPSKLQWVRNHIKYLDERRQANK